MMEAGSVKSYNPCFVWEINNPDNIFSYTATEMKTIVSSVFRQGVEKWQIRARVQFPCMTLVILNLEENGHQHIRSNVLFSFFDQQNNHWQRLSCTSAVDHEEIFTEGRVVKVYRFNLTTEHYNCFLNKKVVKILCEVKNDFDQQKFQVEVSRDVSSFFKMEDNFSDVVVFVKKKSFFLHKFMLAARSPVFAAMLTNDFIEKKESKIVIKDIEPEVMSKLFDYIYSGEVTNFNAHASDLFVAADRYEVLGLKELCQVVIIKNLSASDAVPTLLLSDKLNATDLKEEVLKFISRNLRDVMKTRFDSSSLTQELYKEILQKLSGFDCDLSRDYTY